MFLLLLCILCIDSSLQAQSNETKKPLDHSVYNQWYNIGGHAMTDCGKYASYYRNREENDGSLNVINLKNGKITEIERGARSKFIGDYIVYVIRPKFSETKEAKLKKLKGDKVAKDTLAIHNYITGVCNKYPYLSKIEIPKEEAKRFFAFKSRMMNDTLKNDAVFIYDAKDGKVIDTLMNISQFSFDKKGKNMVCLIEIPKKPKKGEVFENEHGVYIYNPEKRELRPILTGNKKFEYSLPAFSEDDNAIAFYTNRDTTKKFDDNVEIYTVNLNDTNLNPIKVAHNGMSGLKDGWRVSKNRALSFNDKNNRLFFAISKILPQKDTTIKESAKLDVWHYNDDYIQTQQLNQVSQVLKKSYLSCIDLDSEKPFVQLATEEYPNVTVPSNWSADWAYCNTDVNYVIQTQWNSNPYGDLYIISLNDGKAKKIVEGDYIYSLKASPDANYLVWYNPKERNWFSYSINKDEIKNITSKINVPLWNELHDTPQMAGSYGAQGWREGDKAVFINDKYDVWEVDPTGAKDPINLTNGMGRELGRKLRILRTDKLQLPEGTPGIKEDPIPLNSEIWFTAFDYKTKGYGYYTRSKKGVMKKLIMEDNYTVDYLNKCKESNVITFVKSNASESPNLWVTFDNFKTSKKLTDVNPQQGDYNWVTCESVYWTSKDGKDIEGILYKPENFDPNKKYPMVVYFYEKTSNYRNTYRKPALSKSTINPTFFASNGYLVFMPDIHYKTGHPGQSAMNCIIPGVEKLSENSWVDKDNIAIQGQSWGGYQVAYMITQTDMFKCAGAGAPVSNMTSAYGGIRWGSGVVRQFQYEHTQSRIGATPWDEGGLDLYIENSPLFFADKVNTPLLIMHNDKDEAVPWYQGIEYFTALRRLGKVVWMLQYNDESHNISSNINAKDYTIRLSQFMDHYLKGAPMPVWMKYGVPASKKGIDWGLDLTE